MKKKRKITNLEKVDLPFEVKDGIRSRSSMLSATLKTMPEEDLVQEGLLLVYEVIRKNPRASIPYIMKAINNHYASIQDSEIKKKTILDIRSLETGNVERELDARAYRLFQKHMKDDTQEMEPMRGKNAGLMETIEKLKGQNLPFREIAEYVGKTPKTVRKLLRKYGKAKDISM